MCYVVGLSSPSKVKKFLFFSVSEGERGRVFAVFFAPFPEKGILDFIAHSPIIQEDTYVKLANSVTGAVIVEQDLSSACRGRQKRGTCGANLGRLRGVVLGWYVNRASQKTSFSSSPAGIPVVRRLHRPSSVIS